MSVWIDASFLSDLFQSFSDGRGPKLDVNILSLCKRYVEYDCEY